MLQSWCSVSYENGNLTVMEIPTGASGTEEHQFVYNGVDLPVAYLPPLYDDASSGRYVYQYDRDRRPLHVLAPSGKATSYVYTSGLLDTIVTPEGPILFSYFSGGRVGLIERGGESVEIGRAHV